MGIKFKPTAETLRLLGVRSYDKMNEDGTKKTMHFVKLADENTFEANEFMLPADIDPNALTVQGRYNVEIDIDGRWTRLALSPAETAKPKAPAGFPVK